MAAAIPNVNLSRHYSKGNEEQLGANEGGFSVFTNAKFLRAGSITSEVK
jgi:hypothetical protein